jgi:hypothetical protein
VVSNFVWGGLASHLQLIAPPAMPHDYGQRITHRVVRINGMADWWHDTEIRRFSPLTYCHDVVVSPHDPRVLYTCLSPATPRFGVARRPLMRL